jgi:zinc and cadmium transporter
MGVWFNSIISVIIVSVISLIGVVLLFIKTEKLSKLLLMFVSFATGALFGDVFLHLIPEVVEDTGFTLTASFSLLAGLLVFFVLEKFVQWTHCHDPVHQHEHHHKHHHHVHPLATINIVGDALHNLLDGMIIAGSYIASVPLGIATTIAVILHEIPQEIGDFAILLHAGFTKAKALFFNFVTALTAVLGALIVLAFSHGVLNGFAFIIPFTAGAFLYIAGADLLPELHRAKYSFKTSALQLTSIILGIAVMYGLTLLE